MGCYLSILPFIDEEFLNEMEPEPCIKLGLHKVGAVIDGKDFISETAPKNCAIGILLHSNELDDSPMGLIFKCSAPVFGVPVRKLLCCCGASMGNCKTSHSPAGGECMSAMWHSHFFGHEPRPSRTFLPVCTHKNSHDKHPEHQNRGKRVTDLQQQECHSKAGHCGDPNLFHGRIGTASTRFL